MKPHILFFSALCLCQIATAAPAPREEAAQLLGWMKDARRDINIAGRAGDRVALQRIRREAVRRSDAWPNDQAHSPFMDCYAALTDMVSFLQAYERKDYAWRDRKGRQFREYLVGCDRVVDRGH